VVIQGLNPVGPDGRPSFSGTPHTPLSLEALARSVVCCIDEKAPVPPEFAESYEVWRLTPGAGVFTVTIREVIDLVRRSVP
jgi:hypothetical protein